MSGSYDEFAVADDTMDSFWEVKAKLSRGAVKQFLTPAPSPSPKPEPVASPLP